MAPRSRPHPRELRRAVAPLLAVWLVMAGVLAPLRGQSPPHAVSARGAIVYTRTTQAFELGGPPSKLRAEWLVPTPPSEAGPEWRCFAAAQNQLPAGFEQPGFDDSAWTLGKGTFSPEPGKRPGHRTLWNTAELAVRTRIDLGQRKPRAILFQIDHDDGVQVWLNGKKLVDDRGHGTGRQFVAFGEGGEAWQRGENLLAARCTNIGGWQHFDLGMALFQTLPPGIRTADDLQKALREDREAVERVRRELFGPLRAPALLLAGDLDAAGTAVRIAPGDLRDLGHWLAMNVANGPTGGSIQGDLGRLFRLGDLQLKGRAAAVDANGWQVLDVTVKSTPEPAPRDDGKRFVDRFVKPHVWYGFDGRLLVRRRLETRGNQVLVAEFTTELQGRILRGRDWKEHAATLTQRENWQFREFRDNQDAAFRAAVQKALDRGTEYLKGQVQNLRHADLVADAEGADRSYHSGRLALALLALVKGGVPKDDPVVQKGYAELRQRKLIDSYSLGNALQALEALYAPPNEFADLKQGLIDRPRKRTPSPEDRVLMQKWTEQLLANVDTRVDPAFVLRFNYTRGERFDNSVNQYGLLGLYAAFQCGLEVPATTFEAAANHLLGCQSPGGSKLDLDLVDYRTFARRQADPELRSTGSKLTARAAGWSYEGPKSDGELTPTWGSMTCAGITGLSICQAALTEFGLGKRARLIADISKARSDGFGWLAQHLTVRCHPGAIERQQIWYYYFLYGLERAALLSGIALIQDRDWYFEGAMVLTTVQNDDGSWPVELVRFGDDRAMDDTAMAILFLKQSTLPVLTGK